MISQYLQCKTFITVVPVGNQIFKNHHVGVQKPLKCVPNWNVTREINGMNNIQELYALCNSHCRLSGLEKSRPPQTKSFLTNDRIGCLIYTREINISKLIANGSIEKWVRIYCCKQISRCFWKQDSHFITTTDCNDLNCCCYSIQTIHTGSVKQMSGGPSNVHSLFFQVTFQHPNNQ